MSPHRMPLQVALLRSADPQRPAAGVLRAINACDSALCAGSLRGAGTLAASAQSRTSTAAIDDLKRQVRQALLAPHKASRKLSSSSSKVGAAIQAKAQGAACKAEAGSRPGSGQSAFKAASASIDFTMPPVRLERLAALRGNAYTDMARQQVGGWLIVGRGNGEVG